MSVFYISTVLLSKDILFINVCNSLMTRRDTPITSPEQEGL